MLEGAAASQTRLKALALPQHMVACCLPWQEAAVECVLEMEEAPGDLLD